MNWKSRRTLATIDALIDKGAVGPDGTILNRWPYYRRLERDLGLSPYQTHLKITLCEKFEMRKYYDALKVSLGRDKDKHQIRSMTDAEISAIYPALSKAQIELVKRYRRRPKTN